MSFVILQIGFLILQLFYIISMANLDIQSLTTKQAIQNIIEYSEKSNNLLERFKIDFFIRYFDKSTIQQLSQRFQKDQKISLQKFVKELTCFILHKPDQTIFLVMSLIDIYKKISNEINSNNEIGFKDFTYHICKSITSDNQEVAICNKEMSVQKIHPNVKDIRSIDINSPMVILDSNQEAPLISKEIQKIQRKVHHDKPLHLFFYNQKRKEIITLARLASQIKIFDLALKEVATFHPSSFQIFNKSMVILSMFFSQKYQRIGFIVDSLGLIFCDYSDNFKSQKLIKNGKGQRIYYLPFLQEWITIQGNTIYFWDLKYEKIKVSFRQQKAKSINDIMEITHLRCFIVSYTFQDGSKWLYTYLNDGNKLVFKFKVKNVGAQKIHYSRITQTIMFTGLNELPIYQIDHQSYQINLIAKLVGHQTVITSISDIKQGLIMTGDDKGILRIWDPKILRCLQIMKVTKTINNLFCTKNYILFSDSRINVMQIEETAKRTPLNELYGLKKFYKLSNGINELFIFTLVNCRIYDLNTGTTKKVVQICIEDQQILCVEQINGSFIISTSKGYLCCYSEELIRRWKVNMRKYHNDEIIYIKVDTKNKLFTTVSKKGHLNVWNSSNFQQGPRKSISNKQNKNTEIDCFDFCEKHCVFITSQKSCQILIWDYQYCKLCHLIQTQAEVCTFKISQQFPLLSVGCQNEKIYLYKLQRNQKLFKITLLNVTNLRSPENSMNSLLSLRSYIDLNKIQKANDTELFKKLYCNHFLFYHKKQRHKLIVSYGKGAVMIFDLKKIIKKFQNSEYLRTTTNIQRPIRQVLQEKINPTLSHTTQFSLLDSFSNNSMKVIWNKKIHKDEITDIDNFQNSYVSTLSLNGYLKIFCIEKLQIIAKLCIRYPLPEIWNYMPFDFQQLRKKTFEVLNLLSEIIQNKQIKITIAQMQTLSLDSFLNTICTRKLTPLAKKNSKIQVLSDELTLDDIKNYKVIEKQKTIKYLQAFKRVNLMKEKNNQKDSYQNINTLKKRAINQQRKYFRQILSPDYYAKLYGKTMSQDIDSEFQKIYKPQKQKLNKSRNMLKINKKGSLISLYQHTNRNLYEKGRSKNISLKKIDYLQIRKRLQQFDSRNRNKNSHSLLSQIRNDDRNYRNSQHVRMQKDGSQDISNKRFSVFQQSSQSKGTQLLKKINEDKMKTSEKINKFKQNNKNLLKKIHKEVKNKYFSKN